jgi:hypothetical protein
MATASHDTSTAALNGGETRQIRDSKDGPSNARHVNTNAIIAAAVVIYVVYTAIAGPRDYKKLIAGQAALVLSKMKQ